MIPQQIQIEHLKDQYMTVAVYHVMSFRPTATFVEFQRIYHFQRNRNHFHVQMMRSFAKKCIMTLVHFR